MDYLDNPKRFILIEFWDANQLNRHRRLINIDFILSIDPAESVGAGWCAIRFADGSTAFPVNKFDHVVAMLDSVTKRVPTLEKNEEDK